MHSSRAVLLVLVIALYCPATVVAQDSVFPEDLTWTEVRDALASGKTTVIIDTASLLFLNPAMIRRDRLAPGKAGDGTGVVGNPTLATIEHGRRILELQIHAAVAQIRLLRESSRK